MNQGSIDRSYNSGARWLEILERRDSGKCPFRSPPPFPVSDFFESWKRVRISHQLSSRGRRDGCASQWRAARTEGALRAAECVAPGLRAVEAAWTGVRPVTAHGSAAASREIGEISALSNPRTVSMLQSADLHSHDSKSLRDRFGRPQAISLIDVGQSAGWSRWHSRSADLSRARLPGGTDVPPAPVREARHIPCRGAGRKSGATRGAGPGPIVRLPGRSGFPRRAPGRFGRNREMAARRALTRVPSRARARRGPRPGSRGRPAGRSGRHFSTAGRT